MESAFPCHILDMEKDMDGYYELKANGRGACIGFYPLYGRFRTAYGNL